MIRKLLRNKLLSEGIIISEVITPINVNKAVVMMRVFGSTDEEEKYEK